MSHYVDGFLIPIKKKNLRKYKKMATMGKKAWMKHGALDYYECVADKIDLPYGIPFKKLCKLKPDETLIFAYIVYKNKAHRNKVNKKVQDEFNKLPTPMEELFDMKRFSAGMFKTIVRA